MGSYGQVLKVRREEDEITMAECVSAGRALMSYFALKIFRNSKIFLEQGLRELNFVKDANEHAGKANGFIVQIFDEFLHKGHLCLVYELLSHNLSQVVKLTHMVTPNSPGLSLRMIQKLIHQLLFVLTSFHSLSIIHCDLKPENVALTAPTKAHVKVLDFGSSCYLDEPICTSRPYVQSRFYRAPEVLLGYHFSFPIDMWSLGCLAAELYCGRPLFIGSDCQSQFYCMMDVLGSPPQIFMEKSPHFKYFFKSLDVGNIVPKSRFPWTRWNNEVPLWKILHVKGSEDYGDLSTFYSLLKEMLIYDPEKRVTPQEALKHPFIVHNLNNRPTNSMEEMKKVDKLVLEESGINRYHMKTDMKTNYIYQFTFPHQYK
eukprot:TRINITY_DN5568_c0_g1_i4.p1 TRINITY_DN5568_c0_g1~~TRINITY_DN5568_c0_g1_i4.p1  ORF type:complete len:372 (-),score=41.97 TRINITY_DN5568_c0_g1_i4:258-1373(-)